MMLHALCGLAAREKLVETPAFEMRRVDFILQIARSGRLIALIPTHDDDGRAKEFWVPRLPKRTVAVSSGVLVDNATYVLGVRKKGDTASQRAARCADAFRREVESLAGNSADPGLAAVRALLADRVAARASVFKHRAESEWTGSEWLAFQLKDDGELVHERSAVRRLLQARSRQDDAAANVGRCLVSGEIGPIARLHPSIKGIPGAQTSGASVVSFNKSAFESHGLHQGANAPIGIAAAKAYTTALNWLLAPHAGRRHRYGVTIGEAVLVFWTRRTDPATDAIASLFDPSEEQVQQVVESPLRGLEPGELDTNAFFALTLSGAQSRVVVRDWLETTTGEVKRNLRAYWQDLALEGGPPAPRPVWKLLASVEAPGGRGLPPDLATRLLTSALRGTPFPRELLGAALRRLRLPAGAHERDALRDRCSLVKAVLNRQFRSSNRKEVPVPVDESCKEPPYLLGRLFAVLERLQGTALGDVNASIRDRFFGSASATPGGHVRQGGVGARHPVD